VGVVRRLILVATAVLAGVPAADAEVSLASWYSGGGTFCGDREVQPFTAAHKTLPCGAVVRVTTRIPHVAIGRSVVVTIRDRGPFIRGRIIDLDRESAGQIGLITKGRSRPSSRDSGPGVLPVTVERIR
jgi:peptidoglycan lytic transglycosylase